MGQNKQIGSSCWVSQQRAKIYHAIGSPPLGRGALSSYQKDDHGEISKGGI